MTYLLESAEKRQGAPEWRNSDTDLQRRWLRQHSQICSRVLHPKTECGAACLKCFQIPSGELLAIAKIANGLQKSVLVKAFKLKRAKA
jgi:hypothetical protein